ncbi:hypothetical protein VP1G_07032 [Cytospora mali]|uniref:Uncharacterized protein n=1 Tax=Cytospora mali TaxID=578113 RepID=A0A194V7I3_CYTMA|nr:hypothetical protein VP1G_07032 [Valsa mali var. pyri (nom. inval.)]
MDYPQRDQQSTQHPLSSQINYIQRDNILTATGSRVGTMYNGQSQPKRVQFSLPSHIKNSNISTVPSRYPSESSNPDYPVYSYFDATEKGNSTSHNDTLSNEEKDELVICDGVGSVNHHLRDEVRDHLLFDRTHASPGESYNVTVQKNVNIVFHANILYEDCLTLETAPNSKDKDTVMINLQNLAGIKPRRRTWAGCYAANILESYTAARTEYIIQCVRNGEIPPTPEDPLTANLLLLINRRIVLLFTGKTLNPVIDKFDLSTRLHLHSLKMKAALSYKYKSKLWTEFAPMVSSSYVKDNWQRPWKMDDWVQEQLGQWANFGRAPVFEPMRLRQSVHMIKTGFMAFQSPATKSANWRNTLKTGTAQNLYEADDDETGTRSIEMDAIFNFIELGLRSIADRVTRGESTIQQCRATVEEIDGLFQDALGDLMNLAYLTANSSTHVALQK